MTDHAWTAEDQMHLDLLRMRARAETPEVIEANITVGSANLNAFSANIAYFTSRGMNITWDNSIAGLAQVHYQGFYATGDYEDMRDFWNWYRGFFHMI